VDRIDAFISVVNAMGDELTAARAAIRDLAGALEEMKAMFAPYPAVWKRKRPVSVEKAERALTAHADEIAKAQTRG